MCEHHAHEDHDLGPLGGLTGLIHVPAARLAPGDIIVRRKRWVVRSLSIDPGRWPVWASVFARVGEQDGDARQTIPYRARELVHIERRLIAPPAEPNPERELLILVLLELDADPLPPSDQVGS